MILTLKPDAGPIELGISWLDQDDHPMDAPALLDSVPHWTHENPAIAHLTTASDGLTAKLEPIGAGSDLIQVTLSIGGRQYQSAILVNIAAVPTAPVLTQIAITQLTSYE